MPERNLARPGGRFGFAGRRPAASVSLRVAFVAAVASCTLAWASASNAGATTRDGAAGPAAARVTVAVVPVDEGLAPLSRQLVAPSFGGKLTTDASSGDAPADPTPADVAPADPGPADPGPVDPTPAEPAPAEPTPADDGDGPTATPLRGEYAAYVTAIDPANATVTFDVVEWLTGTAAQQACVQDGDPGPWPAAWCNDYYVRNENAVLRTLSVSPTARLGYVDELGPTGAVSLENPTAGNVPTTLSALAAKLADFGPDGQLKCLITVESGALTAIDEIFAP
ncbi:hypothetical protein I6A84_22500 [Frankia sp. CNm7]|nr:hypothetical protein [Frankia nepalensis]